MPFRHLKNVRFENLEDIFHSILKISRLVLHKTFWKNVPKTPCKTNFKTFLKSGLKAIAKLVNGFYPLTIFVKELHRKSLTEF